MANMIISGNAVVRAELQRGVSDSRNPLLLSLLLSTLALTACGAAQPSVTPATTGRGETVPGIDLGVEDEIDFLDGIVNEAGVLHLLWREVDRPASGSGLPEYRARHAVFTDTWSTIETLPWRRPSRPRLVGIRDAESGDESLHAVDGPRLAHLTRSGGAWHPQRAWLADDAPSALGYELAADGDGITAVFVSREGEGRPWRLYQIRWTPRRIDGPTPLFELPTEGPETPSLRLAARPPGLQLLVGVNDLERHVSRETGRPVETFRPRSRLFHARRSLPESRWTELAELPQPAEASTRIDDIALLSSPAGSFAFFYDSGLYLSTSSDDGASWTPPRLVDPGGGRGALDADDGHVVWVDERFRRTDRRWWKPLGGIPWSDSPEWANNDLFLLPLPPVAPGGATATPHRVTPDLSFARNPLLLSSRGRLAIFWAGRKKVGKQRTSEGSPTEIFYRLLDEALFPPPPADEAVARQAPR